MKDATPGKGGVDLEHYARLLLRQKWFMILPAIMGVVLMTLFSLMLKNQYKASTTVIVEQSRLPGDLVKDLFGPDTYVKSLVDQVKSTSSLEKVIHKFNLYPEMRKKQSMEEVVSAMRENVEIANRGNDTFSIAFIGEDPETVRDVAEELTSMFISQNVDYRLEQASKAVTFLEERAQSLRDEVQAQEKKIQEYKSENLLLLPEHRSATQVQLNAIQQRLQANGESLTRAQAQMIASRERAAMLEASRTVYSGGGGGVSDAERRLAKAREELRTLGAQYSPNYPDYKAKKLEVESLEREVAAAPTRSAAPVSRRVVQSPEYLRAKDEARLAEGEIERLTNEQKTLQEQMKLLSQRLEEVPRVELELSKLAEGIQVKRDQADAFQKKATDAAASLALERGNQGSQYRALDNARVPEKPISPNRPLLIVIGAVVGLGIGFALVIGLDLLFRPFLDEQDLARFTGCQVLVSIPHVGPFPSEWQRFRGQVSNLMGYLLGSASPHEEEGAEPPMDEPEQPVWTPRPATAGATAGGAGQAAAASTGGVRRPDVAAARGANAAPNGRGVNTAPGGSFQHAQRFERFEAPPITRANPRQSYEGAGQGNGRIVYSSPRTEEIPRSALRPEPKPAASAGAPRRASNQVEVMVFESPRRDSAGPDVADEHDTRHYPVVEVIERVPGAKGSQTAIVVGGSWGAPTRYLISNRPARGDSGDETMKELYRRAPWTGKES